MLFKLYKVKSDFNLRRFIWSYLIEHKKNKWDILNNKSTKITEYLNSIIVHEVLYFLLKIYNNDFQGIY